MVHTRPTASWLLPALLAIAFVAVATAVWFFVRAQSAEQGRLVVTTTQQQLSQSLRIQLQGDKDFLDLVGQGIADGTIDERAFESRMVAFLATRPRLNNAVFADAGYVIRWAAPHERNKQIIGLSLLLPEPKRAAHEAASTHNASYTKVFEVIQGFPAFEVYVPIYRGDRFVGMVAGVYRLENLLVTAVPPGGSRGQEFSLVNGAGQVVSSAATATAAASGPARIASTASLGLAGSDLGVRVTGEVTSFPAYVTLLWIVSIGLALGLAVAAWRQRQLVAGTAAANRQLSSANEALQATNEQLLEATRAKDDFLASMSHELRTPLNSIIGFSGVMLQGLTGELVDEQRRQVAMINNSGRHLLGLINGVLDLAKVVSGQAEPNMRQTDVCAVAREMFDSVGPLVDGKDVEMCWTCEADVPPIRTDGALVGQILLNLLGNAVKFTEHGHVGMTVSTEASGVAVAVEDTGRGIPKDESQHIFEDFYQIAPPDGGKNDGTGLGLPVSRRLADTIGATIEVRSEPRRGSTFILHVPDRLESDVAEAPCGS